jgi:GNAT superfamily N-acetyltransferase
MKSVIEVREANIGDAAGVFPLASDFTSATDIDEPTFQRLFEERLGDPALFIAIALLDRKYLGYVSAYSHAAFYAAGSTLWVDELFVASEVRGRNIGRRLMFACEEWAAARGCRLIALATAGARDFYQALGYQSTAGYFKKYLG